MNKQLINKYKHEFNHWLNGGSILIKSDLGWCPIATEFAWSCNTSVDALLVINDEYAEFRKALAEGKTIQLNEAEKFADSNRGWVDLSCKSLGKSTHLFPINYYRIKPDEPKFKIPAYFKELSSGIVVKFTEEISSNCFGTIVESSLQIPQKNKGFEWRCWDIFSHPERWEYLSNYNEPKFKIGDFVRYIYANSTKALEINNINGNRYYFTNSEMACLEYELELWTPVKGEWCWFYDEASNKYSHLARFNEMWNNRFRSTTDTPWLFCEPFLNSIPSYLKDK